MNTSESVEVSTQVERRSLLVGYFVWLVLTAVLLLRHLDNPWDALSRYWLLAFLGGGIVTALQLIIPACLGKMSAKGALATLGIYVIPTALLVLSWQAVCAVYTSKISTDEFNATAPIAMLVTQGFGLAFGSWLQAKRGRDFAVGAVLAPVIMAAISAGYYGYGALTSDEFVYRDAFAFNVVRADIEGGAVKADCKFTLKKPGKYSYAVSSLFPDVTAPGAEGQITWKGEAPSGPGVYELSLTWLGLNPHKVTAAGQSFGRGMPEQLDPCFSVNLPKDAGSRPVRVFEVPLDVVFATRSAEPAMSEPVEPAPQPPQQ